MRHESILTGQIHSDKRQMDSPRAGFGARRNLSRRRAAFFRGRRKMLARRRLAARTIPRAASLPGYDPELLYVECGRCGAPVLWEDGRATELMRQAGIDPVELDSSCILVTDGCPACGSKNQYSVRIFRIASESGRNFTPLHGNA